METKQVITCQRCKGTGMVRMVIKPIHGQSEPSDEHWHIVSCPQTGCNNGVFDREQYYKSWGLR